MGPRYVGEAKLCDGNIYAVARPHAERISAESGFEYFDRDGTRHNAGKPCSVADEALHMYLCMNDNLFRLS